MQKIFLVTEQCFPTASLKSRGGTTVSKAAGDRKVLQKQLLSSISSVDNIEPFA